ncbi:MAG: hypothetical protein V3T30_02590 [Thermodesulfobacteriota bacterium]
MGLPLLEYYNSADTAKITVWPVGIVQAGQESVELEVKLWNNKGGSGADTSFLLAVDVLDANGLYIADAVAGKWVQVKSSGTNNPDGVPGFTDDLHTSFTAVGKDSFLKIGDIPNNCSRTLYLKVRVPASAGAQAGLTFTLRTTRDDNVKALPYFFQRAFGDGAVDETVKAIFPVLEDTKVGGWTGSAGAAGIYTGTVLKKYYAKVTTGGALGTAKYSCSDDGASYSATEITTSASATTNVTDDSDVDLGVDIDLRAISGSLAVGDIWTIEVDVIPFAIKAGSGLTAFVGPGNALISNNHVWHNSVTVLSGLADDDITYVFLGADGTFTTDLSSAAQNDKILVGSITTASGSVTAVAESYPLTIMNQELKNLLDAANKQSVSIFLPDPGGADADITNFIVWKAPVDCTVTKLQLLPHAAYVSASGNEAVVDVNKNDGATPIATVTFTTSPPAQGSINDMGALDATEKVLDAGDNITVDLTANGTGDIPAQLLQIDYEPKV